MKQSILIIDIAHVLKDSRWVEGISPAHFVRRHGQRLLDAVQSE